MQLRGEHGERLVAPDGGRRCELRAVPVDRPLGEAVQNFVERRPTLEAGQGGPEAEVRTVAEGEVLADLAVNVEPVTVRMTTVVTVGGPDEEEHDATLRHRLTMEFDV